MSNIITIYDQIACENPNESIYATLLLAAPRTLLGLTRSESVVTYTWLSIIVLFLILYFVFPLCFLNSSNGFLSASKVFLSTILIFLGLVFIVIVWSRSISCDKVLRNPVLFKNLGALPRGLENSVYNTLDSVKEKIQIT